MIARADAVVIGGGILGASVGHFLAKLGFGTVALLEKNELCSGATAYSAANVRQHYSNEVAIRLAVRGTTMFRHAGDELGGPAGFVPTGYMVIAPHGQEDALRSAVSEQQRLGVEAVLVNPDDIRDRFPNLELADIALGVLEVTSGYADPAQTVATLVRSARPWGLCVYEGAEVTNVLIRDDRVQGVATSKGTVETRVVVNAAGPWAAAIGAMVGIHYELALSREHEVIVALPPSVGALPIVSDPAQSLFFRPHGSGRLLVGQGYPKEQEPCDPDTYNRRADGPVAQRMLGLLQRRVPAIVDPPIVRDYAGVYSITPDWYPIVGPADGLEGYFCAAGGSGHAFKIGPPIGEALADIIVGRAPAIDISSLDPGRFTRGATFASVWGPGNRG